MKTFILSTALFLLALSCQKGNSKSKEHSGQTFNQTLASISNGGVLGVDPMVRSSWTETFLELVNDHRVALGLDPLTHDQGLDQIVTVHSQDMANGTVAFGHSGFSNRCSEGYGVLGGGNLCAENVAMGQPTPQAAYDAWMGSPGHRANIENPRVNHTGFGYAKSASGTYYWTQIFIER